MKKFIFPVCCLLLVACGKDDAQLASKAQGNKTIESAVPAYQAPELPDCSGLPDAMRACKPFQCQQVLPLSVGDILKRKVVHGAKEGRCHYSEYTENHQTLTCAFYQSTGRALADFQQKIYDAGKHLYVTGSYQPGVNDFSVNGVKIDNPFGPALTDKTCILPAASFQDGKPVCTGGGSMTFTLLQDDGTYEDVLVACES